ncbi:hypothetical protein ACLBKU_16805 [Erythrobacter sp. NE805]|uniref:hypothetical protein n=1 Tax=Erythrobacter sp. NE805 TaxID=3389875 RepID=UPI00396B3C9D
MSGTGFSRRGAVGALAAGGAALALAGALRGIEADAAVIRFTGFAPHQLHARAIGVASYRLTFLGAPRGLAGKAMRDLVEEAHADLVRRLAAAGRPPLERAELARALRRGGTRLVPGNRAAGTQGSGRRWVSLGAAAAPLLRDMETPQLHPTNPFANLAGAARSLDALLIAPQPLFAFASLCRGVTLADSTRVALLTPFDAGRSAVGGMMAIEDAWRVPDNVPLAAACAAFNAALVAELASAR